MFCGSTYDRYMSQICTQIHPVYLHVAKFHFVKKASLQYFWLIKSFLLIMTQLVVINGETFSGLKTIDTTGFYRPNCQKELPPWLGQPFHFLLVFLSVDFS